MLFDLHLLRHVVNLQNGLDTENKNKFSTIKHEAETYGTNVITNISCTGNLKIFIILYINNFMGNINNIMNKVAASGHLNVLQWLHTHCDVDWIKRIDLTLQNDDSGPGSQKWAFTCSTVVT